MLEAGREGDEARKVNGSQSVEGLACHASNLGLYLVRDKEPL